MSDTTVNIMGQAGFAVHGIRRGFVIVLPDIHSADMASFDETVEFVRNYGEQWHGDSHYMICPATVAWRGPVEEYNVPECETAMAKRLVKPEPPSLFDKQT